MVEELTLHVMLCMRVSTRKSVIKRIEKDIEETK
jgi:hypothetical protein